MDSIFDDDQKDKIQAKIIALAVSASARKENHKALIQTGFYTQFKKNINSAHESIGECNHDTELYGLLNIALNHKYLHKMWMDLKKIYKAVFKNKDIIDFKSKVDLLSSCSKYLGNLLRKLNKQNKKEG